MRAKVFKIAGGDRWSGRLIVSSQVKQSHAEQGKQIAKILGKSRRKVRKCVSSASQIFGRSRNT